MASSITYNGVDSVEGGNIFKGIKFHVANRVPTRKTILDNIESNGGIIVLLEKYADFCIADHARKDAPPGTCSWKLITDSIAYGAMQLHDKYQKVDPNSSRPVGSGKPGRITRTPFTHADDAVLAKWVLEHPGERREGNKLYEELEKINSRHTLQSWRNRWTKNLKLLPAGQLKMLALTATADSAPQLEADRASDSRDEIEQVSNQRPQTAVSRSVSVAGERDNDAPAQRKEISGAATVSFDEMKDDSGQKEDTNTVSASSNEPPEENRAQTPQASASDDQDRAEVKKQFYSDLEAYTEAEDLTIDPKPLIIGKVIELFDLVAAVDMQEAPPEEVDWLKVARDLEYTRKMGSAAAKRLQQCYGELEGFFDMLQEFGQVDERVGLDEEPSESEHNVDDLARRFSKSPEGVVPSSPPQVFSRPKRALELEGLSSLERTKRRRRNPNDEIPSTPDHEIGVVRDNPLDQFHSPSHRRSMLLQDTRQDSQGSQSLPLLPQPTAESHLEPETQDFAFGQHNQAPHPISLERKETTFDVSPSQQLQAEFVDATPIPVHLDTGRQLSSATPISRPERRSERQATTREPVPTADPGPSKTTKTKRALPASFTSQVPPAAERDPPAHEGRPPTENPIITNRANGNRAESNRKDISWWLEYYQSLGYSHELVVKALKCTTLTPGGLASYVMQNLRDGNGVPTHTLGIWTTRDDNSLRLVDSAEAAGDRAKAQAAQLLQKAKKESDRLIRKHGLDGVELRRKFLEAEAARQNGTAQG